MSKQLIGMFDVHDILDDEEKIKEFSNKVAKLIKRKSKESEVKEENQNLPDYLKEAKEGEDYEWVDMTDYFDIANGKKEYDENEP